jgi:hypothetical protein
VNVEIPILGRHWDTDYTFHPNQNVETIMQYMLLIYGDEAIWANMPEAEVKQTMQAYVAYSKALAAAGILRGGSELDSVATATTVRVRNGRTLTADGPFMENQRATGRVLLDRGRKSRRSDQMGREGTICFLWLNRNPTANRQPGSIASLAEFPGGLTVRAMSDHNACASA